jgi:hypothetical protein
MKNLKLSLAAIGTLSFLALMPSKAQIIITEVDPTGSSTGSSSYNADWFEITNYGTSSVSLTGWKMDDNSNSFSLAVPISGVSSINAGQSIVFVEDTSASSDSALNAAFEKAWFGSTANAPAGFTIANYGGSGVGLGSSGDAVNLFNSAGVLQAGVQFGTATTNVTFDNSVAKITNTGSNDGTISTLSVPGKNGAFTDGAGEIGSPGTVGAVPEPSSWALALLVAGGFAMLVRQQKAKRA